MAEIVTPTGAIIRTGFIKGKTSAGGVTVTPQPTGDTVQYNISNIGGGGRGSRRTIKPKPGETVVVEREKETINTRVPTPSEQGELRLQQIEPRLATARQVYLRTPGVITETGSVKIALGGVRRTGSLQYYDSAGQPLYGPRKDIEGYRPSGPRDIPLEQRQATIDYDGETITSDITRSKWKGLLTNEGKAALKETVYEFFASPVRGTGQVLRKGYEKSGLSYFQAKPDKKVGKALLVSGKIKGGERLNRVLNVPSQVEKQTRFNPQDVKTAATWAAWLTGAKVFPTATSVIGTPLVAKQVYTTVRNPSPENVGSTGALLATIGVGSVIKSGKVKISIKVKDRLAMPKTRGSQTPSIKAKQLLDLAQKQKAQGTQARRSDILYRIQVEKRYPFSYLKETKEVRTVSNKPGKAYRRDVMTDLRSKGYRPRTDLIKNLQLSKDKLIAQQQEKVFTLDTTKTSRISRSTKATRSVTSILKDKRGSLGGQRQITILKEPKQVSKVVLEPPKFRLKISSKLGTIKPPVVLAGLKGLSSNLFLISLPTVKAQPKITTKSISISSVIQGSGVKGIAVQKPISISTSSKALKTDFRFNIVPDIKLSQVSKVIGATAIGSAVTVGGGIAIYTYINNRTRQGNADKFGGGILSRYQSPGYLRRTLKYSPSLAALAYNIKGKRSFIETGIGVRPI